MTKTLLSLGPDLGLAEHAPTSFRPHNFKRPLESLSISRLYRRMSVMRVEKLGSLWQILLDF